MKKLQYLLLPSITLVVFIIFTILVKTVDVHYIQDIGFLGFYNLNTSVNNFVVSLDNALYNKVSDLLLYFSFATILPFAIMGLVQLIKRKSLFKVDREIYIMLAGYLMAVISYFIFELVKINYSPLSTADNLKPSYPSSHAFLFITILGINLFGLLYYVKMPNWCKIAGLCCVIILSIAMIIIRLFSGHHYLTDIIGAILLSINLLSIFASILKFSFDKKEETVSE